jgi:hypothetical protein
MQGLTNFERTSIDYTKVLNSLITTLLALLKITSVGTRQAVYPQMPVPQMVIPPPGSVQPPCSTIQEQPVPMPVSYPGYPASRLDQAG